VVVKVRYAPFVTVTHGVPYRSSGKDREALAAAALDALTRFEERKPVRLLGVRAEFADTPE
jgi:DNA polymerase-4